MITRLIRKETKFIEKLDCLDHYDEITKQEEITYSLIKEIAKKETENDKAINSPLPALCTCYYLLNKLAGYLSKLIITFSDQARIKISDQDYFVYDTYYLSLMDNFDILKYEHSILLASTKFLM
jgi:hypothetical protein